MASKREFEAAVKAHFRKLTKALDAELATVVEAKYPASTKFFLFEYDSMRFGDAFSVSAWPMNRDGDVTTKKGHWLLKGKAVAVPPKLFDDPKYEDMAAHAASKLLEKWFVARWKRVRSASAIRPAFIGHHDSFFKVDLKTGLRTNWDEIVEAAAT